MAPQPDFTAQIQEHLDAIAAICRDADMPQWAEHGTLILGDPKDPLHTILMGYQDLDGLLRFVQHLQAQAEARRQSGSETAPETPVADRV